MDESITCVEVDFVSKNVASMLRDVAHHGKEFAIMQHGAQIARLSPVMRMERPIGAVDTDSPGAIDRAWESLRRRCTLGGMSWKELRDEGRRF